MVQKKHNAWLGKAAVAGLIVLGIFVFRYFELGQYLSTTSRRPRKNLTGFTNPIGLP